MSTTVTIHQPNYLPWIGFFQKVAKADIFVILDHVAFSKGGITHRNKIRTKEGWAWLTIPISNEFDGVPIKDVKLPKDRRWWASHYNQIIGNYGKAEYFKDHETFLKDIYVENRDSFEYLRDLNVSIILYIMDKLDIRPEIIYSKDLTLKENPDKTDLNLGIVQAVGGTEYLSGKTGKTYLDEQRFIDAGIELKYFEFAPFEYKQRWEGFQHEMSAIDLLFNMGEKSKGVM